jgi:methanogenic corrinoid protein MtbC1
VWAEVDAGVAAARDRLGRLARAIEHEVIPKLVQLHRAPVLESPSFVHGPDAAGIDDFVARVLSGSEEGVAEAVDGWRARGLSVERIYLELLTPAARRLGQMWEDDTADFAMVTVGLGRLQRLLRELSPAFGSEVEHPPQGRRVLLSQPQDEQHGFGLSMVAEFFRRAGWEIRGGPSVAGLDPVAAVQREWFDVIGFSIGAERRIDWVTARIAAVRRASRNSSILVLVGGPIFVLHPEWGSKVGADAVPVDGAAAPRVAETMLAERASREVRGTRPVR